MMSAAIRSRELALQVREGSVQAGVELIELCRADSLDELVRRVCPRLESLTVDVFDVIADAMRVVRDEREMRALPEPS